ncbi:MlaD family protein [Flavobacterium sp.]|uniref:MlaD family protein n=1 Tax=Flavobacterium sp. TaxID=239 RepID=UPI002FDD0AEA
MEKDYKWKLGMFVILGITLFMVTIYYIGNNNNLFSSTFHLKSYFKNVSGLKEGNNVRFSGINIGTVKNIEFISDSVILVHLTIKENVRKYIKTDAIASIGSDGLMGDKILTISPGSSSNKIVENNATIASVKTIEFEDLMMHLRRTVDNAENATQQLSQFSIKVNQSKGILNKVLTDEKLGNSLDTTIQNLQISSQEFIVFTKNMNDKNGTLSRVMTDPKFANSIEETLENLENSSIEFKAMAKKINNKDNVLSKLIDDERLGTSIDSSLINIEKGSKNLIELEEAAKHNFLLRGYFRKKKKAEEKKKY